MAEKSLLGEALELAEILRPSWPLFDTGPLVCEDPAETDPPKEDPPKEDPPEEDPPKVTPDDDWKSKSRKNETRAKRAEKERDELAQRLKEIEESNQSETEKAIAKAREEAAAEARAEADKERRADKLEVNVTRLSAKGFDIEVKDGDETKTETVKFADPDDALVHIERAIDKGDIDADEIFEDGKVNQDALTSALADILERKPHLRAGENGSPAPRPKGGAADAGKGGPSKELEAMSPADHARRKYGEQKNEPVQPPAATRR